MSTSMEARKSEAARPVSLSFVARPARERDKVGVTAEGGSRSE
jgi:Mg-chelatase subunit ChlD